MTIFELVRVTLDHLYSDAIKAYGSKADTKIAQSLIYLSRSYGRLNDEDRAVINYKDPAIRFAYVYKYVAAHGDYIVQVMNSLRSRSGSPIFAGSMARVTCFGGGPGSDIIGVLKYLDEQGESEPVNKVICYLLDAEQAWADAWTELDEALNVSVALNTNFQPLDVTRPDTWEAQKKFLQADLFTMSYFVSEVKSLDGHGVVTNFWKRVFREAKPGALFLYVDNGHADFNSYFDELWLGAGLKCPVKTDNVKVIPRYEEQASELKEYSDKFAHNPKVQAQVSYRILRKP